MGWHVIAKQEVHNERPSMWFAVPDALMTIPSARAAYDRGEIEMATRRSGHSEGLVINELVVWPRKKKADRRPWFSRSEYDSDNVKSERLDRPHVRRQHGVR